MFCKNDNSIFHQWEATQFNSINCGRKIELNWSNILENVSRKAEGFFSISQFFDNLENKMPRYELSLITRILSKVWMQELYNTMWSYSTYIAMISRSSEQALKAYKIIYYLIAFGASWFMYRIGEADGVFIIQQLSDTKCSKNWYVIWNENDFNLNVTEWHSFESED